MQNNNLFQKFQKLGALLVIMTFAISGCTSMQPVTFVDGTVPPDLVVGDWVTIETMDGTTQSFTLTGIDTNGLQSESGSVAYAEISSIQVQRSAGSSTMLVYGAMAVLLIAAAAGGGGGGGGY